jgi:hypothetical protein
MGEIGGNDYNYPFFLQRSIEEIRTYVPLVIKAISSAINVRTYGAKKIYFIEKCINYCIKFN